MQKQDFQQIKGAVKVPDRKIKSRIEYLLQYSLGCTTVQVKELWNVCQSGEKYDQGLKLDCWVDSQFLEKINYDFVKVCNKNFQIDGKGLVFSTGYIDINRLKSQQKEGVILLVKVCVGNSYCVPKKYSNQNIEKLPLPEGFDSIYYYNDEEDNVQQVYRHEYRIFDKNKVQPMFLVEYAFDEQKEKELEHPACEICGELKARYYCQQDNAPLCEDCRGTHMQVLGKLASKHIIQDIGKRPKMFGDCEAHHVKMELYCETCKQTLCIYCKINGSHSQGDNHSHKLKQIQEAYDDAMKQSKSIDISFNNKKAQLSTDLNHIDTSIKQLEKNANEIEQEIYSKLSKALSDLQEKMKASMSQLIGQQLELKRQYDHIQWLESFLKYQQETLSPSDYLNAWSRHNEIKEEILDNNKIKKIQNDQKQTFQLTENLTIEIKK